VGLDGSGIKGKVVMALCNDIPTLLTSVDVSDEGLRLDAQRSAGIARGTLFSAAILAPGIT
jgi:hypothetical protein